MKAETIETTTFADVERELLAKGYYEESLAINKKIVELKSCPNCRRKLAHRGFSKMAWHRVYGICECGFFKLFWIE